MYSTCRGRCSTWSVSSRACHGLLSCLRRKVDMPPNSAGASGAGAFGFTQEPQMPCFLGAVAQLLVVRRHRAMNDKSSIDVIGIKRRLSWFFVLCSFTALICFFSIGTCASGFIFSDDIGPTFGHFKLPGAILGFVTASVCTWAFLVCPRQNIFAKLSTFILLIVGLNLGFASIFTYLMFTWFHYDPV